MRRLLSWLVYPGLVASALAAVHVAMARGVPPALVLGGVQVVSVVVIALLERWMPEHASWNVARGDVRTDAIYLVVSGLLVTSLIRAAVLGGLPSLGLWPTRWPLALQVFAAIAIADLPSYLTHLVDHRVPWLWPIHAPHHSAPRLYWLNATRMHPLDQGSTVVLSLLPLALLGAPPATLALFDAFAIVHLLLQHSNIRLRQGPLSLVIATAEFHRWHHSRKREESECNYASFLSLWDLLFRTFRMPAGESAPEEVGLYEEAPFPDGFLGQLRAPFTAWHALLRRP
ncbi:MAG: sterol desaturase family protein [Labilithrix sp.]